MTKFLHYVLRNESHEFSENYTFYAAFDNGEEIGPIFDLDRFSEDNIDDYIPIDDMFDDSIFIF
jgi:hypothetical protein